MAFSALAACAPETGASNSRAAAPVQVAPAPPAGTGAAPAAHSGAAGSRAGDNSHALIVGAAGAGSVGGRDALAAATGDCSAAAKLIYVVDEDGRLSSFNPATNPPSFVDITQALRCPVNAGFFGVAPTPYSMSVDRSAIAWVLYSSGDLFRVSTADGSCQATSFQSNQSGFQRMGMGFVANSALSNQDTLYVAGGAGPDSGSASRLGTVDLATFKLSAAQALTGWPELTGTGLAELWGFYPDTSPPKIAKLNKATATEEQTFALPVLQGTPAAWAFAFWGGDFWIFLRRVDEADTTVYRVDGTTGMLTTALQNTRRTIVGAGVSTCAPVDLL